MMGVTCALFSLYHITFHCMHVIYPFCFSHRQTGRKSYYAYFLALHYLVTVTIVLAPLLRVELDESVDPHDSHAGLDGALELLDLAHAGLQHAGLQAVVHAALCQVEAVVAVALGLGDGLGVGI
jgi:hypothetical protein